MFYSAPKILILSFAIILFSACDKEQETEEEEVVVKSGITMGDEAGMRVVDYDTTLNGGYNDPVSLDFDLDGNGIDDIRLISREFGSLGAGTQMVAEIECLHPDAGLSGETALDTIFVHRVDTSCSGHRGAYKCTYYTYYLCHRVRAADFIDEVKADNFHLTYYDDGESIDAEDYFESSHSILYHENGILGLSQEVETRGDTVFYTHEMLKEYCQEEMQQNKICYVGVRIKDTGRLGWVKLELVDGFKIRLLQTAIEQ